MPWRTQHVMDLRMEFVRRALQPAVNFRALCRETGISPKTGYKWRQRFLVQGMAGLGDGSRRPHRHPAELPEAIVCELVRLKESHRHWGPRKIRALYARLHGNAPSESSCKRVLCRAGLVQPRRVREQHECGRITRHLVAEKPNDVWTVDFKGWWRISPGQRCEPLTVRDAFSRCVLCVQAMPTNETEAVRAQFEPLFAQNGLPLVIRSDNGPPFAASNSLLGLSRLACWWLALGIDLDRIRPGHPEENGAHERMHRDIRQEIEGLISGDLREQQAALDVWRQSFNCERPHEALGLKTPAEIYKKSERPFRGTPEHIEYEPGHLIRRVNYRGAIKLYNQGIFLSESLRGWNVGLKPCGGDQMEVWFARLRLGTIDLSTLGFQAAATPPLGTPASSSLPTNPP